MKGAKGFGRIFRRPRSPYWWVSYTYRGREVRESSKSTKKSEAVDFLKARLEAIRSHSYIGPKAETVSVADLLADLVVTYEIQGRASLRTLRGHVGTLTER